jgi:integrase
MRKFTKITRSNIRQIDAGQKLIEHGVEYKRLHNGDGHWTVAITVDGRRIRKAIGKESDGVTLTQVLQFIEKVKTEAREDRLKLPKGRKLARRFEEAATEYIQRLRESDGKNIDKKVQHFKLHLTPYFQGQSLDGLNNFEVERFKKHLKNKSYKPGTINRILATLRHLLNKSVEWGWFSHPPVKITDLREDNARLIYLTVEQQDRLLQEAKEDINPQIYLFIMIGLNTAMRRSEILTIQVSNIDVATQTIYIPKAKAGARVQPITPALSEYLEVVLASLPMGQDWLFPSIGNMQSKYGHTTSIEEPFRRVVKAAGLDSKEITPHVLRHTATTHLVQAGVDIPTVQAITGHKTPAMVHRYAHQNGAHIRQAMDKLQNRINSSKGSSDTVTSKLHQATALPKPQEVKNPESCDSQGSNNWYPQGNSNPCRLREREVS